MPTQLTTEFLIQLMNLGLSKCFNFITFEGNNGNPRECRPKGFNGFNLSNIVIREYL